MPAARRRSRSSIQAAPVSGSFDGVANLSENSFFNGQVTFNSPSLRRMLEWSRTDLPPGASSGPVALSGKISGDRKRLKLDNAEITLDGNPGAGVLELAIGRGRAGDHRHARLRAARPALVPGRLHAVHAGHRIRCPAAIDVAFAEKYNLDLRLSSAKATAGDLSFSDVAATAQVKGDLTAFDISDATIFGGTVQAGIRYDRKGNGGNLEVRLLASDVETGRCRGARQVDARGAERARRRRRCCSRVPGRNWNSFLETAAGSFSASLRSRHA